MPRLVSFKPIVKSTSQDYTSVSKLIGPNHTWNEVSVQQNFTTDNAKAIMRISLPSEPEEDEVL